MRRLLHCSIVRLLLLSLFFFLLSPSTVSAAPRYPVKELDSCRDQKECRLYCQIPVNQPACWSYGKYVQGNVLGDATTSNITFPIAELGNCNSATACFAYCTKEENQSSCKEYGEKNGLSKKSENSTILTSKIMEIAKEELGCSDQNACKTFCAIKENNNACQSFAQKYLSQLQPTLAAKRASRVTSEVMEKAKEAFGCSTVMECKNYCENPLNQKTCMEFAKKHKLTKEEAGVSPTPIPASVIARAKEELGCTSKDSCSSFCENEENKEKCFAFSKNLKETVTAGNALNPAGLPQMMERQQVFEKMEQKNVSLPGQTQAGCRTEQECREFCARNPALCPGFPSAQDAKPVVSPNQTREIKPTEPPKRSGFSALVSPKKEQEQEKQSGAEQFPPPLQQ